MFFMELKLRSLGGLRLKQSAVACSSTSERMPQEHAHCRSGGARNSKIIIQQTHRQVLKRK